MIDWQIMKDGNFPDNYDVHNDGCWFPDWHYQELLLPYFNTGELIIDEYGKTDFCGKELLRLEKNLAHALDKFEANVDRWEVTTNYISAKAKTSQVTNVIFEGEKITSLLVKTLEMIQKAKAIGGCLSFSGD